MITKYSTGPETLDNSSSNLIEIYKSWRDSDIRADLQKNRSELIMIYQNLAHDFNKASAIRSGNAFLVKESYFIGPKKVYDKRGAVGTHHFENIYHAETFDEVFKMLKNNDYKLFAVDNLPKFSPKNIFDAKIPIKSAFVFGEENLGLSDEIISKCDEMVYIQQYGSVRSLNVACAASCIMLEYCRKYRRINN